MKLWPGLIGSQWGQNPLKFAFHKIQIQIMDDIKNLEMSREILGVKLIYSETATKI